MLRWLCSKELLSLIWCIYITPNPIFKINQRSVGVARIVVCSGMLKKFWVWRIFTRGAWVYARIVVCSEKINKNVLGLKNISEDNCDLDSGSWWLKTNIIVARVQTSDFESWQDFFPVKLRIWSGIKIPHMWFCNPRTGWRHADARLCFYGNTGHIFLDAWPSDKISPVFVGAQNKGSRAVCVCACRIGEGGGLPLPPLTCANKT